MNFSYEIHFNTLLLDFSSMLICNRNFRKINIKYHAHPINESDINNKSYDKAPGSVLFVALTPSKEIKHFLQWVV